MSQASERKRSKHSENRKYDVNELRQTGSPRRSVLTHNEGRWLLAAGDLAALITPFVLATVRRNGGPFNLTANELGIFAISSVLWIVLAVSIEIYSLGRASSFTRTHRATLAAFLVIATARSLYKVPGSGLLETYGHAAMAFLAFALWRSVFAAGAKVMPFTKRVLIIGAGVSGTLLAEEFWSKVERDERDYHLVGFVDDDPAKIDCEIKGYPVLGDTAQIPQIVEKFQVDTIALAVNRVQISAGIFAGLVTCKERGIRVWSMPALYETLTERIAVEHVGDNWGIMFPVEHRRQPRVHDLLVRLLDICAGLFGLLVTALVIPVIAIANRFGGSPGPLFYSQLRVGKGGKDFRIYKFRSMVVDAEKAGAKWATENDPRITKVGNFYRKTRLDELPQFWNVLKGEMSLIGPRPERPEFTAILSESIPFFRARHAVKPGLTGWAQVMYRYGASEEDSLIKLQYDLYYIKHRSPALDLRIIAKSIRTVLMGAGR
jgi:exopolysaccharide biosynthesis polyprenyl glycosylphosphotransferase